MSTTSITWARSRHRISVARMMLMCHGRFSYRCECAFDQMNVCFIADNPETTAHPVIGAVLRKLRSAHSVRLLDVSEIGGDQAVAREKEHPLADIYLLKSHTPQALELAHYLERRGALAH